MKVIKAKKKQMSCSLLSRPTKAQHIYICVCVCVFVCARVRMHVCARAHVCVVCVCARALPISFFIIFQPEQYWVWGTDN